MDIKLFIAVPAALFVLGTGVAIAGKTVGKKLAPLFA